MNWKFRGVVTWNKLKIIYVSKKKQNLHLGDLQFAQAVQTSPPRLRAMFICCRGATCLRLLVVTPRNGRVSSAKTWSLLESTTMARHGMSNCFQRVKYGAMIGGAIGVSIGALFGSYAGIRYGLRGRELVNQLGKAVLQTGGTFGAFMAIGSALRCWRTLNWSIEYDVIVIISSPYCSILSISDHVHWSSILNLINGTIITWKVHCDCRSIQADRGPCSGKYLTLTPSGKSCPVCRIRW